MVDESSAARMERDVAKLCNVMQRYARFDVNTRNARQNTTENSRQPI
jgi:hypothetical protein